MSKEEIVIDGIYSHYKNDSKLYKVIALGFDATNDVEIVQYVPLYECPYSFFTRTIEDFTATVSPGVKRFKRV